MKSADRAHLVMQQAELDRELGLSPSGFALLWLGVTSPGRENKGQSSAQAKGWCRAGHMIWAVLSGPGGLGGCCRKGGWHSFHLPQSLGEGVDASVCACRGLAQTQRRELGDAPGL